MEAEDWPIGAGSEADSPDNYLTVKETVGIMEGRDMTSGDMNGHYGVQIRIRAEDRPTARSKADAIVNCLNRQVNRTSVTVGTNNYLVEAITLAGNPIALGTEIATSKRYLYVINALVAAQQLT
jgi:hypothetical protein